MEDHGSTADTLVEEREDVMHPPSGGNPTRRNVRFLKPVINEPHKDLPSPPCSLFSSKPTLEKIKKYRMRSFKSSKLNLSGKWKIWVDSLKPRYQEVWKEAGVYEAIMASTYTFPKDKDLILGLAERWCVETNTFIFPWGKVSITLEDVLCLGNYSVLGASFSAPVADEYVYIFKCLKYVHKEFGRNPGAVVTSSAWMEYFMCGHRRDARSLTTPGCRSGCAEVRPEDVEEDSHTIAQSLSRSRKIESSGKRNDLDHEPVLNINSKTETPTKSKIEEESYDHNASASELPELGLEA